MQEAPLASDPRYVRGGATSSTKVTYEIPVVFVQVKHFVELAAPGEEAVVALNGADGGVVVLTSRHMIFGPDWWRAWEGGEGVWMLEVQQIESMQGDWGGRPSIELAYYIETHTRSTERSCFEYTVVELERPHPREASVPIAQENSRLISTFVEHFRLCRASIQTPRVK